MQKYIIQKRWLFKSSYNKNWSIISSKTVTVKGKFFIDIEIVIKSNNMQFA